MSDKKNLLIWCLYDFANSFVLITFLLYFSKWLVVTKGLADWWYNASYIVGSFALVLVAPRLGASVDRHGTGQRYLALSTIGCFVFYCLAVCCALYDLHIALSLIAFGVGNFFYQLSFVFYNPLLEKVSRPEEQGMASGIGFLCNYVGQIAGILASLPLVSGTISFGVDPLLAPLIPAAVVFILLSLPLLLRSALFAPDIKREPLEAEHHSIIKQVLMLAALPGMAAFLWSFFMFSDALTTFVNNFSIFTTNVFGVSNQQLSLLTILVIVMAGIGSWFWGWMSDRYGCRQILTLVLVLWVFIVPAIALAPNYSVYFALIVAAGLCIGGSWSVSRQLLIILVPKGKLNSAFGLYAIAERSATIVGPLAWSGMLALAGYRWAMLSLNVFLVLSVLFMLKLAREQKRAN